MKKLFALLLALLLVLSLAACGGEKTDNTDTSDNSSPAITDAASQGAENGANGASGANGNEISTLEIKDIRITNVTYNDEGSFNLEVVVDWVGEPVHDAWIGIVPADVPHGSEETNDEYDTTYLYFSGKAPGDTFTFEGNYLEAGEYTLRVNESDGGGAELAWYGFKVSPFGKVSADGSRVELLSKQAQPAKTISNDGSKLGVLQTVAEQQSFVINGLYLSSESGQHKYPHIDDISAFGIDGLNSEFELNEWIGFYVDTDRTSPMNIYIVRNDAEADYSKITEAELESICYDKGYPVLAQAVPDAENRGFVGQAYVNPDSNQPDLFNAFFVADGQVCYMVQLDLIAQAADQ